MNRKMILTLLAVFSLTILGESVVFAAESGWVNTASAKLSPAGQTAAATKISRSKRARLRGKAKSFPLDKAILKPVPEVHKYNEPFDLIELIPVVRDINRMIPRRFSIVNHEFTLSANQMVIRRHFHDLRSRNSAKNSTITFSYFGDIGQSLSTRLDVPLFYSPSSFSQWEMYPVGNYTMAFNRNSPAGQDSFYIKAQTRF